MKGKQYNQAQVDLIKKIEQGRGVTMALKTTIDTACMVLKDKHGWSEEQVQEFESEMYYAYESVADGYISVQDIRSLRSEDSGIQSNNQMQDGH
jgi:hypothetical protein